MSTNKKNISRNSENIKKNNKYSFAFIFPRFSGPYGGEKICLQTINQLVKLGHSVDLYTTHTSPQVKEELDSRVKIIKKPQLKIKTHHLANLIVYFLMPLLAQKVAARTKKTYYHYIVGQTWQSALALWSLRKKFKNHKLRPLLIYHCFEPPRFLYDLKEESTKWSRLVAPLIRYLDKKAVEKGSDKIIAISDLIKKWVTQIYQQDAEVVYPGIELKRFKKYTKEEARQLLNLSPQQEIFFSVSKLHKRKRLKWAMRIFKEKKQSKDALFIIAGQGPEEEELKRYAEQLKISKQVKFVGKITGDEVVLWHKAADYFIFTAKNEPYGIAPQEARISGAKVLPHPRPYPIWSWKKSVQELLKSLSPR